MPFTASLTLHDRIFSAFITVMHVTSARLYPYGRGYLKDNSTCFLSANTHNTLMALTEVTAAGQDSSEQAVQRDQ